MAIPSVQVACANGHYKDRGPALPIGNKARCAWCGSACWNRGCSECTSNFHKTCYYAHLSQAKTLLKEKMGEPHHVIPPKVLEEKELKPFLMMVGMSEYFDVLSAHGIHGHADLVKLDDEILKRAGMAKVVHRRKLLRQIAQVQATLEGVQPDEEPCVLLELEVKRASTDVKLGFVLSEQENTVTITEVVTGSVGAQAGFEPGMVIVRINSTPIHTQEDFMKAIFETADFMATVKPKGGDMPPTTFERLFPKAREGHVGRDDFEKLQLLGKGAFSEVFLVRHKTQKTLFALKTLDKRAILSVGVNERPTWRRDLIMRERDMMKHTQWAGRGLVKLHHTFQSSSHLFFVLDYCPGGDLYEYMGTMEGGMLPEVLAKYYAAQVFLALRTLHQFGIVYRDLKPENILLDEKGNAKLADFGLSRPLAWGDRATTFIGTPEYMAPEMIKGQPYSYAVDWWAYGVVCFNLLTGEHAFGQGSEIPDFIWRSILESQPVFNPAYSITKEAKTFISSLLEKDPDLRLEGDVIRRQPWLRDLEWGPIETGESLPPCWSSPVNMITDELASGMRGYAVNSPMAGPPLTKDQQDMFLGFSYSKDLSFLPTETGM
eukprot:TRINITY_DN21305_c0_g1_i2.p1 TRINITY_DN21305_c0_g1~~TRINITY_DN21305_c0_g1_i2.p1  ORF type:complete len:602 (+),score=171.32 TRINITY_DN21305_c0_g1_i2:48-1853(+)